MLRCVNCGYSQNLSGIAKCEKCGTLLSGNTPPVLSENEYVSKTIDGQAANQPSWDGSISSKPNMVGACGGCGYPLSGNVQFCPNCGNPIILKESPLQEVRKVTPLSEKKGIFKGGTIDPWQSKKGGGFTLTPVARDGELAFASISFSGDKFELNRDNLEPSNNTITSKGQAIISQNTNGNWVIENRSQKQTTFIRIDSVVELKKGDYLLMGDRLFKFDF